MLENFIKNLNETERAELENYCANKFVKQNNLDEDNQEFLNLWRGIIKLKSCIVGQILNEHICYKRPVKFNRPEDINIIIYNSIAGELPVIKFGDISDFENFIINLLYKGDRSQAGDISQMGASFIFSKTQRFLALSNKYYSNTPPEFVNLETEEWRGKSAIIRLEHECTHYYTKKFYGSASNNLRDELIADFVGLYEAFKFYNAKLFQHFMGLDDVNNQAGRLSLYTVGLSKNVQEIIKQIAVTSSNWLESWQHTQEFKSFNKSQRINYLCENLKLI
ncbi:MAG: hypothetical protein IJP56_00560 [Synergistaceae bacterium]|nr:hypothetical protein [Synergistaceae bacterium]